MRFRLDQLEREDRLFEAAGKSPEDFERLLERFRKKRKRHVKMITALTLLVCLFAGLAILGAILLLHHLTKLPLGPATLATTSTRLHWGGSILVVVLLMVVLQLWTEAAGFHLANERVKTLVLLRGLRESRALGATE